MPPPESRLPPCPPDVRRGLIGGTAVMWNTGTGVILDAVSRAGAAGVLLDTNDKRGPGLRQLITPAGLARVVATAHDAGLLAADGKDLRVIIGLASSSTTSWRPGALLHWRD